MNSEGIFERHERHINPTFVKLLRTLGYARLFVRAKGTRVWDDAGREYLDMMSGCGSANLGYNHPEIVAAAESALRAELPSFLQVAPMAEAALLAESLANRLGPELSMAFFCNSGAEAVEGALKLAFAATRRSGLLYCKGSYHGLTLGTLSVMGHERYRGPFPSLPECRMVTFGDLEGATRLLEKKKYAAFVVEPVQIEGGMAFADDSYFRGLREACRRSGTALVFDEVQTGMGRLGSLFAFQALGVVPDAVCYAKAFSGGLVPIGGYSTSPAWLKRAFGRMEDVHLQGSTFGGNSLACAVARRNLELIDDALLAHVRELGDYLGERLHDLAARRPRIEAVRGRGLAWGVKFGSPASGIRRMLTLGVDGVVARLLYAHWVAVRLLEEGFVTETLSHDEAMLRIEPALTVTRDELDSFLTAFERILEENESFGTFARNAGRRLFERHFDRTGAAQ